MIVWKEEYRVGIESIDEQHKKLLEIADRVVKLLQDELITDKYDKIVALLEELKEYTVYHFTFEEAYMKSIGYSKLLSHKVAHDDFIEKISNIDLNKIDDDQDGYLLSLLDFVADWIGNHIMKTDKKYAGLEPED
ncbi:MAG: hemerythrin-like metal-binding protein [Firmicutes bacterium]|nr:hemerythrin-like metal-binding protein [Bacillota bacterium]